MARYTYQKLFRECNPYPRAQIKLFPLHHRYINLLTNILEWQRNDENSYGRNGLNLAIHVKTEVDEGAAYITNNSGNSAQTAVVPTVNKARLQKSPTRPEKPSEGFMQ